MHSFEAAPVMGAIDTPVIQHAGMRHVLDLERAITGNREGDSTARADSVVALGVLFLPFDTWRHEHQEARWTTITKCYENCETPRARCRMRLTKPGRAS
jgi:hypothetical protein